jgi:transposase-like protein
VIVSSISTSCPPVGYRFPRDVIAVAVRWHLRYGLSYRDVAELLTERGVTVDHVTVYRWVQTFTPEFVDAARAARHVPGSRWFADETDVKVCGRWHYLYRAIDQYGHVIDVRLSNRRNAAAAQAIFTRALRHGSAPVEITTDTAPGYPHVVEAVVCTARHMTEQHANNTIETDHGRLNARLRPIRGPKRARSLQTIAIGSAFVQSLRRRHTSGASTILRTSGSGSPSTNSPSACSRASSTEGSAAATPIAQRSAFPGHRCHRTCGRGHGRVAG